MKPMLILLLFMLSIGSVNAAFMENVLVEPSELWLGDMLNVSVSCLNGTIDRVYMDINGPDVILPSLDLQDMGGGVYRLSMPGNYFDRRGDYTAHIYCVSNGTEISTSKNFVISELTSSMSEIPDYVYSEDMIEVVFIPKKNDDVLISDVTFSAHLDGESQQFAIPPIYDTNKGWLIRVDAPDVPRVYNLAVTAHYQGKDITSASTVEIKAPVEFEVLQIGTSSILPKDNVTFKLRAMQNGENIPINGILTVRVGSTSSTIRSVTENGDAFDVSIATPDLSPGEYQLTAEISYNGTIYSSSIALNYVSVFSGKIRDGSLGGVFTFFKGDSQHLQMTTRSDGTYSAEILPGEYDVQLEFADATIKLDGANVNKFKDAIEYDYEPSVSMPGFTISGIYHIDTEWDFDVATVVLKYGGTGFANEADLKVFKCSNWNSARNSCVDPWVIIFPDIDSSHNRVSFTVSDFSVFAVGIKEEIKLSLNFDRSKYGIKDFIRVTGSTAGDKGQLTNVTVRLRTDGWPIDHTVQTNHNGVFSLDFLGPEQEGNYTLIATAKKHPYVSYNMTHRLEVLNMPSISVVFPGSVQVKQGNTTGEELLIVNTGQKKITDLDISLELSDKYYSVGDYDSTIGVDEKIRIPITFFGPMDEQPSTASAKIIVKSNEFTQDKIFGFTVLEYVAPSVVTGKATSEPISLNYLYVATFAIFAFTVAIALKKKRSGNINHQMPLSVKNKNTDTSTLHEIRNHIQKNERG